MKVLVIPDIHLKTWIFDCAEEIMTSGKAERAGPLEPSPVVPKFFEKSVDSYVT
jgi:hypothetical protein